MEQTVGNLPVQCSLSTGSDVNTMLFGSHDDSTFVPADQKFVLQESSRLNMIGMIRGQDEADYPKPVDLVQTLSEKQGDTYIQWRLETRKFPGEFLVKCWEKTTAAVNDQITEINEADNRVPHLRFLHASGSGIGHLLVICDTKYDTCITS